MELFDLYTKDREYLGRTIVRGEEMPEGCYHLVVHVCIFSSDARMLIQQRQPFKAGWPNLWDVTVGGSAVSGDNSQSAAEREVLEEIGYPISLEGIRPALTIHFDAGFDDIYLVEKDLDIAALRLQPEEVQAVRWATLDEILSMIDSGTFIPWKKDLIRLLFASKNRRGNFSHDE